MMRVSELRQDLVTGEWVVVATGRARRPNEFVKRQPREQLQPKSGCPFEALFPEALLAYSRGGAAYLIPRDAGRALERSWWLQVVPNKYPAFGRHGVCSVLRQAGPYRWQDGVGFHEVVVTRDHTRSLAAMTSSEAAMVLAAYRDRYRALEADGCVRYISIFHNHGRAAGATVSHPHSQIIAIPVVPPDIGRSLRGSGEYYRKYRQCVHCTMLRFERKEKRRVIFANRTAIVFCPFVSRQAFEVRVFPIRHNPRFEEASAEELAGVADALRVALAKIGRGLGNPAYNFFIHTAPVRGGGDGRHYHWHIEIIPKTAVWAGFEIGTGIEISTTSPEAAAAFLRKIRV